MIEHKFREMSELNGSEYIASRDDLMAQGISLESWIEKHRDSVQEPDQILMDVLQLRMEEPEGMRLAAEDFSQISYRLYYMPSRGTSLVARKGVGVIQVVDDPELDHGILDTPQLRALTMEMISKGDAVIRSDTVLEESFLHNRSNQHLLQHNGLGPGSSSDRPESTTLPIREFAAGTSDITEEIFCEDLLEQAILVQGVFGDRRVLPGIRQIAADEGRSIRLRLAAVKTLRVMADTGAQDVLLGVISRVIASRVTQSEPWSLADEAARTLGEVGDRQALDQLKGYDVQSLWDDPAVRSYASRFAAGYSVAIRELESRSTGNRETDR